MKKLTLPLKRLSALILCLCFAVLAGCAQVPGIVSGTGDGVFPVEVNGVSIGSKPQKVAVLSPSLADVVLALGCDTQLTVAGSGCAQEQLRDLNKVDPSDVQGIQAAGPDLVLLDQESASAEEALKAAGLTVLNVPPAVDREDYERMFSQVSSALLGEGAGYDAGIETAQDIFLTLDEINRIAPTERVTTACYLYDLEGSGVTGDMFGTTIMTYSGVTNAFKSLSGGRYEFDDLRLSDPNLIFCRPGLLAEIEADSRFEDFQAVRNGKVIELSEDLMKLQGRTIVTAALEICGAAFPELLDETPVEPEDPKDRIEDKVNSELVSSALGEDSRVYPDLKIDDQGDDVLAVQSRLEELGYLDTEYDGHYGEYTDSCVREFQKQNGLPETGEADSNTQRLLFSNMAKSKNGGSSSESPRPSESPEPDGSPTPSATPEA